MSGMCIGLEEQKEVSIYGNSINVQKWEEIRYFRVIFVYRFEVSVINILFKYIDLW